MAIAVVTSAEREPLTVDTVKKHLHVDTSDDDVRITAILKAARERIEALTRKTFASARMIEYFDDWPSELSLWPVSAIHAVRYYDTAGVLDTLTADEYAVDLRGRPHRFAPGVGTSWPALRFAPPWNRVEVEVQVGYGVIPLPERIKQAILLACTELYDAVDLTAPIDALLTELTPIR